MWDLLLEVQISSIGEAIGSNKWLIKYSNLDEVQFMLWIVWNWVWTCKYETLEHSTRINKEIYDGLGIG